MKFEVLVEVRLRPGIADPQGQTIERTLPMLGYEHISAVSVGKAIRFVCDADSEQTVHNGVEDLCKRFLTNPVSEDATITGTKA